jgi:hypothetical protein
MKCKGANAAVPRAKVAYESIEYGVWSIGRGIISGGRSQPQVAGGRKILNSRGNRIVRSVIDSVLCHRPSHLLFNSALHPVLNAVLHSALRLDNLPLTLGLV